MDARDETALHALALIAQHHNIQTTVEQLLHQHPWVASDTGPAALVKVAQAAGLRAQALEVGWADMPKFERALPALVRLSNGNAMLLVRISLQTEPQALVLRDPCGGPDALITLDADRFSEVWTGEIILFKRDYSLTDEQIPFGMNWISMQLWKERRLFRDIGLSALVMSFLALVPPIFFLIVLHRVLPYRSVTTLNVLTAGLIFFIAFETLFGYLRRYLINFATNRIDSRINVYVMDKLLRLPMDFFERTPTGRIAGDVNEIWRIRHFLTGQLFGTVLDSITLVVLLPAMFLLDWRLSFIVLALGGLMCLTIILFLKPMRRQYRRVIDAERRQHAFLIETIHGMRAVKSMALDPQKRMAWDVLVARAVRERAVFNRLSNIPSTITQPLERLMYIGAVAIGAYMVINEGGAGSAGVLVAFAMIAGRVAKPLADLAQLINQLEEARGAVAAVARVMNEPEEQGRTGGGARPRIHGTVGFDRVRYAYPNASSAAIDDVSFDIESGSLIGVMGRSGSGKTTITRLLQGLAQRYDGLITIDGVDIREFDVEYLRSSLGVVLQDSFLFNGTVRENVAIARPSASFDEVVRAARLAGAEEFIQRMPRGFETMIEEGAANLSGGQRQRLAIARALLTDPKILILDEATSALDAESEAIVNANLLRIAKGRTVIMISHRLSVLVPADKILVMERGRLEDSGTHKELLARCEIYRHLWFQQNRHEQPTQAEASQVYELTPPGATA